MTTSTLDPPAPTQPPSPRRFRLTNPILAGIAALALLLSGSAFLAVVMAGKDAQNQAQTVAADTAPAVLTLDVLCKRQDQLGNDLRTNTDACGEKVDKAKQAVEGQAQPNVPVAGISRDDVAAIVAAQLAGKTVTVDQVMSMVIDVYRSNPPKDGAPGAAPTADQILSAVQAVCSGGKCQGPKGDAAPPVSPAEIYVQVQAFCGGEGSPCRGLEGERGHDGVQGAQGISVTDQRFVRDDQGACVFRVTYSNPSGGTTRVADTPAGDAACPAAPPSSGLSVP
jgi:hypothetical protein